MTVTETFKSFGELWSDVEYGSNGWDFINRTPSDRRRGVYAFISEFGIEKVGKIENVKGVAARSYQYISSKKRCDVGKNDASDMLWHIAMTTDNELVDTTMEFWFIPLESVTTTVCGVEIETAPIRALEHKLSVMARSEGNPMRLAGGGN